ncbi:MAG: site-2 protease family protein [Anaerolineales bacterium]|nr:site-2 protease family protein [Anaerolineales bacterium]
MLTNEVDRYTPIVSRFLDVEDVTHGDGGKGFLLRYRGLLRMDSAEAYDSLAELLRPLNVTPLFRKEHDRHVILLVQGVIQPKPSRLWINGLLFLLTVISVVLAGLIYTLGSVYEGPTAPDLRSLMPYLGKGLGGGLAFAASFLSILLAHEFGHYLAGRYHRTHVTLPYFLPLPLSPFGTMGAFIQLKEPPKNKRVLLDIGIAGPLAGLIVTIPVLILGLSLSEVSALPRTLVAASGMQLEGNSLLYLLTKFVVFGRLLPAPSSYDGLPALVYWARYFFTGQPLPLGGMDVLLHPVAWAGWAGLLITSFNLIPAGQLDGGHLIYVLVGKNASRLLPLILAGLVILGLFWNGWWLWAVLILLLGGLHGEPLDQITPLDMRRRWMAVLGVIIFILVFTPVPLIMVGL